MPEPRPDERAAAPPLRLDPRLLLGGVLALVLLAGVASSGVLWRRAGGSPLVHASSGREIAALVLLAAVVGVAIVALLGASVTLTHGGWRSLLLLVLVVGALLYALALLPVPQPLRHRMRGGPQHATTAVLTRPAGRARPFHVGHVGAWWWAAGLGAAALALAALELRRRQAPVAPEPEADAAEEVRAAVDLSLAEIEQEADPRLAVIKAYARMESTLAASGVPRRAVETSLEYMARALGALRVTRPPVERLTALFHEAKYSRHRVDVRMKADAVAALVAIRDQLGMEA